MKVMKNLQMILLGLINGSIVGDEWLIEIKINPQLLCGQWEMKLEMVIISKSYISGLPFFARISICGPPGNSIPRSFAVLSKASPKASSIVVPNLLYFPRP